MKPPNEWWTGSDTLKIRADLLKISTNAITADGNKAEPELQQVQRVIDTQVPISPQGGAAIGSIPGQIVTAQVAAGEMAQTVSHLCGTCKWFDNDEFVKVIKEADSPLADMEQRRAVNAIRAGLLDTNNGKLGEMHSGLDGDMDVEQALRACGFCKALTEHYKEPIGVHPLSRCPAEVRSATAPHGYYKAKNRSALRVAGSNYDKVMQTAAGKLVSDK